MKALESIVLIVAAALLATPGCRKKDRHFVPAPAANRDGGFELETVPGSDGAVAVIGGDGGVAAAGDGDGDSSAPAEGSLTKDEISDLLGFLDKELPADLGADELFTKLARKCGVTEKCVDQACGTVLMGCSGEDKAGCGKQLLESCPAFSTIAGGSSGDALASATETWVRDLWGDLVIKLRLSLPDKMHQQVDQLATRHQL